jgi:hypothetical protein
MKTWLGTTKMNLKWIVHIQNDYDNMRVVKNCGIIKHAPIKFKSTHWVCMNVLKNPKWFQMCRSKKGMATVYF